MSQQRTLGALKVAEQTSAAFIALVNELPNDATLTKRDVLELYVDANVLVLNSDLERDRDARAFVKWADEKGVARPRSTGAINRLLGEDYAS